MVVPMLLGAPVAEPAVPARRLLRRRSATFVAGYGNSADPPEANLATSSHRACRRRLAHCLRQHREFLVLTEEGRAAFDAALASLRAAPEATKWSRRVRVEQIDVTFWLSRGDERANSSPLRGVDPGEARNDRREAGHPG